MQYVLMVHESSEDRAAKDDPTARAALDGAYADFTRALVEAGLMRGGEALAPAEIATVVSRRGGELVVQDGPYADTKEQLGGFYVIEAKDLDEALAWAAKCPAAKTGKVEVRPTVAPPQ